jgi:hypothetical protein
VIAPRTPLNRQQIVGFWAAWFGWMLDGMDSVIFALVLAPALTELLPRSGMQASSVNIGFVGSIMFALFLVRNVKDKTFTMADIRARKRILAYRHRGRARVHAVHSIDTTASTKSAAPGPRSSRPLPRPDSTVIPGQGFGSRPTKLTGATIRKQKDLLKEIRSYRDAIESLDHFEDVTKATRMTPLQTSKSFKE